MKFIVKDIQGEEHGPIDQETLIKWVEEDRVTGRTEVRNALLKSWKRAEELDFLAPYLAEQKLREREVEDNFSKAGKAVGKIGQLFKRSQKDKRTAFVCKYLPEPAPLGRRVLAALFDWALIGFIGVLIFNFYLSGMKQVALTTTSKDELRKEDILNPEDHLVTDGAGNDASASAKQKKAPGGAVAAGKPAAETARSKVKGQAGDDGGGQAAETADGAVVVIGDKASEPELPEEVNDNLNAISPPSIYADLSNGYSFGSLWVDNMAGGERYVCISAAEGKAMWIKVALLKDKLTNLSAMLLLVAMLYYGVALGFFAQTFGMWYWGIFIVKKDTSEVFFLRAWLWTVLLLLLGVAAPLFIYIFRWAPHDLLARVKVIQVAGTPPAG